LLTGVTPFSSEMPLEVLVKKASEPAPDPRYYNPHLPAEIADILQMALAKDPYRRFEAAGALGEALEQVRCHGTLPASVSQVFYPAPLDGDLATTARRPSPPETQAARRSRSVDRTGPTELRSDDWSPTSRYPDRAYWNDNRALVPVNQPQPSKGHKYWLIVAALAAALLLALSISTIASG